MKISRFINGLFNKRVVVVLDRSADFLASEVLLLSRMV